MDTETRIAMLEEEVLLLKAEGVMVERLRRILDTTDRKTLLREGAEDFRARAAFALRQGHTDALGLIESLPALDERHDY